MDLDLLSWATFAVLLARLPDLTTEVETGGLVIAGGADVEAGKGMTEVDLFIYVLDFGLDADFLDFVETFDLTLLIYFFFF